MSMGVKRAAMCASFLLMLIWIGQQYYVRATAPQILLAVQGGDPRDLLSGHYIRYQVDYGNRARCERKGHRGSSQNQCVCLRSDPKTGIAEADWFGACDSKPADCELSIRGVCRYGGMFIANIERYYIPESCKGPLAVAPANSRIEVAVPEQGNAMVTNFYIEDKTAEQYCIDKQ